jgi:tetratricopeptide (TPR) repeat protein
MRYTSRQFQPERNFQGGSRRRGGFYETLPGNPFGEIMKLILLFNLFFGIFCAQTTFTVIGVVRDQAGQAVSGVRFTVIDENYQSIQSSFVDASGQFRVSGLRMGKYTVRIETSGTPYEEQSQQLELQSLRRVSGDETFPLEIQLKYKKGNEPATRNGSVFAQEAPKAARAEFERGENNLKRNKAEAAIASFEKAVRIFPDYFEALESLGVEYVKDGQYESAVESLTRAIKINSRAPKSLYALGLAYMNLHRLAEAIEYLGKSAQLDSNNINTQMMLGLAYGNAGAIDKSEAAFKKALQMGGAAAAEAHFYLAGLSNKQGDYREARQELELFLREAKNVKDPARIKAMIEKLKEKETSSPIQPQIAGSTNPTTLNPSSGDQSQPSSDSQSQALNQISNQASTIAPTINGSAGPERSPNPPNTDKPVATSSENNALLSNPIPPLPPEISDILQKSGINGGAMHNQLLDYTYTLKKTRRVLDERGDPDNIEAQVFEAYPIRGEHVLIRLSTNGIPSPKLGDDRKRAVKQLEDAERQHSQPAPVAGSDKGSGQAAPEYVSAGVTGVYNRKSGYVSISVSAFLRACEFFSPREEKVADRDTLAINFRRRAGASLPSNQSYISKLVGTVWIDRADMVITRLEAWPAAQAAFDLLQSTAPRDDAALIYQQGRQDNGLWFPTIIRMNAGGRPELFDGLNWDVVFEFSDYQRFKTSASDPIIKSGSKAP